MEKTLHILPCKPHWAWFAYDWIGSERDTHDVLRYPVQTNVHYLPEDFSEVEMMKVAISWGDPKLYEDLKVFAQKLSEIQNYEKVVVWHAEDPDSRLLFCTVVSVVRQALYEIDITPEDRRTQWKQTIEDEPETERDVNVFCVGQVGIDVTRASYSMKPVTEKMRERLLTEWRRWGGEDAQDCPVLVNQYGELFHTYRTYLYGDIFELTSKTEAISIAKITEQVLHKHPQLWYQYVCDTVVKMADEGMIKWVKKDEENSLRSLVKQYKYDVTEDWLGYPRDFLYHFIRECGKKITMSEDHIKAEYLRERKDCADIWGHGHLTREYIQKRKQQWKETLVVRWAAAFNENWGWYHLLSVIKVKLEMMAEYMRLWSPLADGSVYADQMERTIKLIQVVLDSGGKSDYAHTEDENEYLDAEHFSHYVNFRNRNRIPSPDYCGEQFWCEAQRLRFDKAWNLLWEMFRTKLLSWED